MEITKGKWEARCMGSEGYCIYAKNGKTAGEMTREEFRRNLRPLATLNGGWEEQKANANLIAAAPNMAEAIRCILEDYRDKRAKTFLPVSTHTMLLNALAKAEEK